MIYTVQVSDPHALAYADGTDVRHLSGKREVLAAWSAGFHNTWHCADYWGGDLPCMSDAFTVTVWRGRLDDVTDIYPDAEVTIGRHGGPVWRRLY